MNVRHLLSELDIVILNSWTKASWLSSGQARIRERFNAASVANSISSTVVGSSFSGC
jgi:hypothetical protein